MKLAAQAVVIVAMFLGVGQAFLALQRSEARPGSVPAAARDRFASCFESVVPRRQFVCPSGEIWTRTVDGWSVDRPTSAPRVPKG